MIDTSSAHQKYSTIHHYQPVAWTHSITGYRQQVSSTHIISTYHKQISTTIITHRHIICKLTAHHQHIFNILSRHHQLASTLFWHHVISRYQLIPYFTRNPAILLPLKPEGRLWDDFSVASLSVPRSGDQWWLPSTTVVFVMFGVCCLFGDQFYMAA